MTIRKLRVDKLSPLFTDPRTDKINGTIQIMRMSELEWKSLGQNEKKDILAKFLLQTTLHSPIALAANADGEFERAFHIPDIPDEVD